MPVRGHLIIKCVMSYIGMKLSGHVDLSQDWGRPWSPVFGLDAAAHPWRFRPLAASRATGASLDRWYVQPAMKARMVELEQQTIEIEVRLAEAPADLPEYIRTSLNTTARR
jgi:hypothetical protein